ncbi:hypothetical protein [Mycobacterium avium]|uniref:hypothetical protein n=1 Tax=Mycobacterium avium TaxID=1764 RepID=UPI00111C29F9|nr:hypothetical protein [Mycobacterium avium]
MTTGSAKKLARMLRSATSKPETITDPAAQGIIRRMQARGILGDVAGMPPEVDPAEARWQAVLAFLREEREAEERRKAEAEAEVNPPPETAADMLRCALSGASSPKHLPLNGAGILLAALAGGTGTINGQNE